MGFRVRLRDRLNLLAKEQNPRCYQDAMYTGTKDGEALEIDGL